MENNIYLTIPVEYEETYKKLLYGLSEYGKDIISDCNVACKSTNSNIITCWNLFQAAIACKEIGKLKEADLYINYIDKQLNVIFRNGVESIKSYNVYAGFVSNESYDFDVVDNDSFTKFTKETIGNGFPKGDYSLVNPTHGSYLWFFIPTTYNIKANNFYTANGMFALNMTDMGINTIQIDGKDVEVNCYRAVSASIDGDYLITIK